MFKNVIFLTVFTLSFSLKTFSMGIETEVPKPMKFVAISNLLFDTIVKVPHEVLDSSIVPIIPHLAKGSTTWVNAGQSEVLSVEIRKYNKEYSGPGGSAANTIAGLKKLGEEVGVIGALANDNWAVSYKKSLKAKQIQYRTTYIRDHSLGSGNCTVLITNKDKSERTMLTNLGVSGSIVISYENLSWILSAECLIVEGYLFHPEETYQTICLVAEEMKQNNKKVALTLSADFCVRNNLDRIKKYMDSYVDIIIGNDTEMQILTKKQSAPQACEYLRSKGLVGAVTCGADGAYVFDHDEVHFIQSPQTVEIVDTTGAGDQFLAGFLYGLFNEKSLFESGQIGATFAGKIIQSWGGQPD